VSNVIISDILDWDYLPIVFHILDYIKTRNISEPVKKSTDWEWFRSLASDNISPTIESNSRLEADKTARDFTASTTSEYRLTTSKFTLSDINNDLPGLDLLLKLQGLESYGLNPGIQSVKRQLTASRNQSDEWSRKKALELWEALHKERWTNAPTATHSPLGLKFQPLEKANAIVSWLENQFTPHDLCDEIHERRVGARVQALLVL
jgi:hypothetical protein